MTVVTMSTSSSLLSSALLWLSALFAGAQDSCDIFLAPSSLNGGGWGVFAARDFEQFEVVELSPLFLPINHTTPVVKNSVLDDYHYGYRRGQDASLGLVSLGMIMFYNHDKEPNIQYQAMGREPSPDSQSSNAVGFFAKRDITRGEELFSSYGLGDDGAQWFKSRRLDMKESDETSRIALSDLDEYKREYCSKMYAGIGSKTLEERVRLDPNMFRMQTKGMPSADAPNAVAKVPIKAGERIEIAPALVLHSAFVEGTVVAPLVFLWQNLSGEHHAALKDLREQGQLTLQYQAVENNWHRVDKFESFETAVIFPGAGSIGMVERVGTDNPNCRMDILSSKAGKGNAGLVLEVIATKDIAVGETLRLNIPPVRSTLMEQKKLIETLETTGQPLSDSLLQVKQEETASDEL